MPEYDEAEMGKAISASILENSRGVDVGADALHDHLQSHQIAATLQDDDVGKFAAWLLSLIHISHRQGQQLRLFDPRQIPLVADVGFSGPTGGGKQVHILRGPLRIHKGHQSPVEMCIRDRCQCPARWLRRL